MDETVGDRVARLAKAKFGWSAAQIAKELSVSYETLRKWKSGETAPNRRRAAQISEKLGVSVEFVMFGTLPTPTRDNPSATEGNTTVLGSTIGLVPLISWVQAGAPNVIRDLDRSAVLEWLPCPVSHSAQTMALRVTGDSMFNPSGRPSYADGDVIFVDPERVPQPGERCVVRLENHQEATFKQLVVEDGRRILKALNPEWHPRYTEITPGATMVGLVIGKWVAE